MIAKLYNIVIEQPTNHYGQTEHMSKFNSVTANPSDLRLLTPKAQCQRFC